MKKSKPTTGVKKLFVKARQHYAEDEDYQFMLKIATASPYWYAPLCMEIAYLCRMRLSEVLDMTDANELPTGLLIKRRKGSRDNITAWNDRLKAAWQTALTTRNQIVSKRKQPHPFRPNRRSHSDVEFENSHRQNYDHSTSGSRSIRYSVDALHFPRFKTQRRE
jgi:hypothetical protein